MTSVSRAKKGVSRPLTLLIVALLLFLPLPNFVEAAGGDLDLSFGINGKVVTNFYNNSSQASDLVIQKNGKITVAGNAINPLTAHDFAVARYNVDGSLDTNFGSGGKSTTDFFENFDLANALAMQDDEKIILVGRVMVNGSSSDFGLVRYNTDGSLDTGFGIQGKVNTDFFDAIDSAESIAIQSDGKIVVVGSAAISSLGSGDFALARYNADGSLDATFGSGGKVTTDFFGENDPFFSRADFAHAVAIQSDGKIIAAGKAVSTTSTEMALARYNSDGSLDSSFGLAGKVVTDFLGGPDAANGVAIQSNGKIVVAGSARNNSLNLDFALARYNSDGSLDTTFGSNGKMITDFDIRNDEAQALAIQKDGKIVVTGVASIGNRFTFGLARYAIDGSLDTSFGSNGKITTSFISGYDFAQSIKLQDDNKIVVAGIAYGGNNDEYLFALARYDAGVVESPVTFDSCIQDDSSKDVLRINTTTGAYQLTRCRDGFTIGGIGTLSKRGCTISFQDSKSDRRIMASIDTCSNRATASVQIFAQGNTFTLTDRNTTNNTCSCPNTQ